MGVYATAIYDLRNVGKVQHGDTGRAGAVVAQTTNLVNAAANSSIAPIQKGAATILNGVDKLGSAAGVSNAATKVTGLASKAVNPLLCVASGVRILKDDDQYAALIEEGAAMGTMFASEKLFKKLVANPLTQADYEAAGKMASGFTSKLANWAKNLSKGKKTALTIAADVALVAVSIISFDIGKNAAKTVSNREERAQNSQGLDYNT